MLFLLFYFHMTPYTKCHIFLILAYSEMRDLSLSHLHRVSCILGVFWENIFWEALSILLSHVHDLEIAFEITTQQKLFRKMDGGGKIVVQSSDLLFASPNGNFLLRVGWWGSKDWFRSRSIVDVRSGVYPLNTGDFVASLTDLDSMVICRVTWVQNEGLMFHGNQALTIIWPVNRLVKYVISIDPYTIESIFPLEWKLS